jgi:serine/threonine-protein kinase HipA
MKKPLNVFFERKHVGTLAKKPDDTIAFQYSTSWLGDSAKFPLSPALQLQEEAFNNRQTKAYFDNLLPEGETLKKFEKILNKSFEDPYQLLQSYGLDCAGALEVTPSDTPPAPEGSGKLEQITFEEIDKIFEKGQSLYVHSLTAHKGRFSIAGAQDKIPVIFRDGKLFIPTDSSPTTHILKPPVRLPSAFESVHNEYYCMKLAGECGLEVPEVKVIGKETPLFLIERFDRRISGDKIERIHQFDLCQAQGYPAGEKYEDDGGPSFAQGYKCVEIISDNKIKDLETTLKWLAFNLLIGNNDSHSKNLSFLYESGETTLAPLYDLLSTSIYPDLTTEFAFQIGGQRQWHQLRRKNLKILASELGFIKREEIVAETIVKMAERVEVKAGATLAAAEKEHPSLELPGALAVEISKRARALREKLK